MMEILAILVVALLIGLSPAIGPAVSLWIASRQYNCLGADEPEIVPTERDLLMQSPRWSKDDGLVP